MRRSPGAAFGRSYRGGRLFDTSVYITLVFWLTRASTPVRLALVRVWSRRGRAGLAALGAAAGAALLATVLAAALTVSDRTMAHGIAGLPGAERQVAAGWGGVSLQ